jgi:hypothetical protein
MLRGPVAELEPLDVEPLTIDLDMQLVTTPTYFGSRSELGGGETYTW